MRILTGLLIAVAAVTATSAAPVAPDAAATPAGSYVLDERRSSLTARVGVMRGAMHYPMRFAIRRGSFDYDPAQWRSTRVVIEVDPRSPDAERSPVSRRLARYFEPDRYPTITFLSQGLSGGGARGALTGDLTLHGVTRPVTLNVAFDSLESGPSGARVRFSGTGKIKRSRFGIGGGPFADDDVALAFEVEFVRR